MCEATCAPDLLTGFLSMVQLGGVGRLKPNTVCFGFKKDWKTCSDESAKMYETMVAASMSNGRGVMILRDRDDTFALKNLDKNLDHRSSEVDVGKQDDNREIEESAVIRT